MPMPQILNCIIRMNVQSSYSSKEREEHLVPVDHRLALRSPRHRALMSARSKKSLSSVFSPIFACCSDLLCSTRRNAVLCTR